MSEELRQYAVERLRRLAKEKYDRENKSPIDADSFSMMTDLANQPQPASSTDIPVNIPKPREDTIGPQPKKKGLDIPWWLPPALGITGTMQNFANIPKRIFGGDETNLAQAMDQTMRPMQSTGQNIAAGAGGLLPYMVPVAGQAAFIADLLTQPKEIPELAKGMAESSKTTKEAIYGKGLENTLANIFKPFSEGDPEAQEILRQTPVESAVNVGMLIGGPKAIKSVAKGGVKLGKDVKTIRELGKPQADQPVVLRKPVKKPPKGLTDKQKRKLERHGVVPSEGKKTVYRGTTSGEEILTRYRPNEQIGFGIHFTESKQLAQKYATDSKVARKGKKPHVLEAELYMKSPLDARKVVSEGDKLWPLVQKLYNKERPGFPDKGKMSVYLENAIDATNPKRAEAILKEAGYDGVIYDAHLKQSGVGGYYSIDKAKSYVVFDKNQIKVIKPQQKGVPDALQRKEKAKAQDQKVVPTPSGKGKEAVGITGVTKEMLYDVKEGVGVAENVAINRFKNEGVLKHTDKHGITTVITKSTSHGPTAKAIRVTKLNKDMKPVGHTEWNNINDALKEYPEIKEQFLSPKVKRIINIQTKHLHKKSPDLAKPKPPAPSGKGKEATEYTFKDKSKMILSKNTIPNEGPYRITYLDEMNRPIEHKNYPNKTAATVAYDAQRNIDAIKQQPTSPDLAKPKPVKPKSDIKRAPKAAKVETGPPRLRKPEPDGWYRMKGIGPFGVERATKYKEWLEGRKVKGEEYSVKKDNKGRWWPVVRDSKPSAPELGAFGAPETWKALGGTARKATDKLVAGFREQPELVRGRKAAKELMINHDRQVRYAESTHQLLKKTYDELIPDRVSQQKILRAVNEPGNKKLYNDLTPQEKGAATWMVEELNKQKAYNRRYEIVPEAQLRPGVRYIKGWYRNPKTGEAYKGKYGKFAKSLPESKHKKYQTYREAEAVGLKPVTYNLGDIIGEGWESLTRAHAAREMLKGLGKIQAEADVTLVRSPGGMPKPIRMIESWDKLTQQGVMDSYERALDLGPNVKYALERRMPIKGVDGTMHIIHKDVGIHKSIADHVQAYVENPTYGKLSEINFLCKSLKLGVSVFHPMMLGWQELANFRIPFKNIPRGLKIRKEMSPELRLLHQEGLELWKGYEDVGYRNKFFEGEKFWGKAGNVVTTPVRIMRDFVFDIIQPGMKTSFAFDMLHRNLPRYLKGTKWTKEQVLEAFANGKPIPKEALRAARDVVRKADGHFSGEHYKRSLLETNRMMVKLYFSPTARARWQGGLLSPTWQREHLLVAKDIAKSFIPNKYLRKMRLEEMGGIRYDYQRYALGAVMIVGAVDAYNYMMTQYKDGKGKHLWQNPESYGFAVRAPWDGVEGQPVYFRPLKSVFEVAEFGATLPSLRKLSYKMSPWISVMANVLWPDKYHKDVNDWKDVPAKAGEVVEDLAMPITVHQWVQWMKDRKTIESATMNTFGFPTRVYKGEDIPKKAFK